MWCCRRARTKSWSFSRHAASLLTARSDGSGQIPLTQVDGSRHLDAAYNTRITVKVTAGDGRGTAYASVIDARTQDVTYVPAQ